MPNPTLNDRVHEQVALAVPPEWRDCLAQAIQCIGGEWTARLNIRILDTPEGAVSDLRQAGDQSRVHLVIVSELAAQSRRPVHLDEFRSRIGRLAMENAPRIRVNAVLIRLPDALAASVTPQPSFDDGRIIVGLAQSLTEIRSATGQTLDWQASALPRTD
ncbi:hypothetical protein [Fodinicurvata sp. EGI_FJ10296]|uniref:hypothetical protein n=1 Tax=Fodinicurvata sp. EGI_FJ10296 TaxID=3231908 RepID=UPI003454ADF4